jgi:hypothetical protein
MTLTSAAVPSALGTGGVTSATSSRPGISLAAAVAAGTAPSPSNSTVSGPPAPGPKPSASRCSARACVLSAGGVCTSVVCMEEKGTATVPSATTVSSRATTRWRVTVATQPARKPWPAAWCV